MADYQIGDPAIDRGSAGGTGRTQVARANPATGPGIAHTVRIHTANTAVGIVKVGLFFGTPTLIDCRDWVAVTGGGGLVIGLNTFAGLALAVQAGDWVGAYIQSSGVDLWASGGGGYSRILAHDATDGVHAYTNSGNTYAVSIEADVTPVGGGFLPGSVPGIAMAISTFKTLEVIGDRFWTRRRLYAGLGGVLHG